MTDGKYRLLSPKGHDDVKNILRQEAFGYLAVQGNTPYVVPINFAYAESDDPDSWGQIFFHSGPGRKAAALAADPRICLAVATGAGLHKGEQPCNDSFNYRSILVEGKATLLDDLQKKQQVLCAIVAKYDPEAIRQPFSQPFNEQALAKTLVYSVGIEVVSFKQKHRA